MNAGDKVICVDDQFAPGIAALYTALPAKGRVYVIRDVRIGIRVHPKTEGDVSVLLVGLVNPKADSRAALERGFSESRFETIEDAITDLSFAELEQLMAHAIETAAPISECG